MNINNILESVDHFSYEQLDFLIGILNKRQIEKRREEIAQNAVKAIASFHKGELKTETADELIKRLQLRAMGNKK